MRIIRVFHARAKEGAVEALARAAREEVVPEIAAVPGVVAFHAGLPHGDSRDFLMVMVFEDLDAVRAFAGDDYETPVLYGDTPDLIEEMSLHHYEAIE
jgi:quinol monooxygenase YgiN